MTATATRPRTVDLARCERGAHPEVELNPDGVEVCADCASVIVHHLASPCTCERGPVVMLIGFDACCLRCGAELLGIHLEEIGGQP